MNKFNFPLSKTYFLTFILKLYNIVGGIIFAFLVIKYWGLSTWGEFALAITILQILSLFGRGGLDITLLKFSSEYFWDNPTLIKNLYLFFIKVAIFNLVLVNLIFVFSVYFFTRIYNKNLISQENLYLILILTFFYTFLLINTEALRSLKKYSLYLFLQQGIYVTSLILLLLSISLGDKTNPLIFYAAALIIHSLASFFIWLNILISNLKENYKKSSSSHNSTIKKKDIFQISIPLFLSTSLALTLNWMDTLMLGILSNKQNVGIYSLLIRLLIPFSIIWNVVNIIISPYIATNYKSNLKFLVKLFKNTMFALAILSSILFTIYIIFGKNLLNFFLEKKDINTAYYAMLIIALGFLIRNSLGPTIEFMSMSNLQKYLLLINGTALFVNFFLNLLLIQKLGIFGAALSTSLTLIISSILRMVIIENKYRIYFQILGFKKKEEGNV